MYIACIEAHIVTTMKSLIKMVKYMPMVHLYKRKYVVYIYYRDIYIYIQWAVFSNIIIYIHV